MVINKAGGFSLSALRFPRFYPILDINFSLMYNIGNSVNRYGKGE